MKGKLLPCPCCGSGEVEAGVIASLTHGVTCKDCGLNVRVDVDWNNPKGLKLKQLERRALAEAIRRWNNRNPWCRHESCRMPDANDVAAVKRIGMTLRKQFDNPEWKRLVDETLGLKKGRKKWAR